MSPFYNVFIIIIIIFFFYYYYFFITPGLASSHTITINPTSKLESEEMFQIISDKLKKKERKGKEKRKRKGKRKHRAPFIHLHACKQFPRPATPSRYFMSAWSPWTTHGRITTLRAQVIRMQRRVVSDVKSILGIELFAGTIPSLQFL